MAKKFFPDIYKTWFSSFDANNEREQIKKELESINSLIKRQDFNSST